MTETVGLPFRLLLVASVDTVLGVSFLRIFFRIFLIENVSHCFPVASVPYSKNTSTIFPRITNLSVPFTTLGWRLKSSKGSTISGMPLRISALPTRLFHAPVRKRTPKHKKMANKGRISLFQPVPPYIRFSHWDGSHGQDLKYARNPPASNRGFASFRLERVPGSSP